MESSNLAEILKVLKEHGVAVYRNKNEDNILEIVFKDSAAISEIEDAEEHTAKASPPGVYSGSTIGLKFESFDSE